MALVRVLHSELLKLKRTLAFRVIFIAPLLVAFLQFFVLWKTLRAGPEFKLWENLTKAMLSIWAVFMMPLLITLETALINGIEHSDKHWKHIFALPVRRHTVYIAKIVVVQALISASTLILCVLSVLVGWASMRVRPELANAGPVPYGWIAKYGALVWLASWLIISIHSWISIRWSSFTVALGAGIGGTFFALFAASAQLGKYYPWLLPLNVFTDQRLVAALVLGVAGGVVAAVAGCMDLARRDVA